jgi:hypothetical protein
MFRRYRPQDCASKIDLVGMRPQLDWRGLLELAATPATAQVGLTRRTGMPRF